MVQRRGPEKKTENAYPLACGYLKNNGFNTAPRDCCCGEGAVLPVAGGVALPPLLGEKAVREEKEQERKEITINRRKNKTRPEPEREKAANDKIQIRHMCEKPT